MKLVYVCHSGFILEGEDFVLVIDYCRDSGGESQGVVHDLLKSAPKKWYVLVSHHHADHFNPDVLQWRQEIADIQYVFSGDVRRKLRQEERNGIVFLSKKEEWGDGRIHVRAYGSTDVGVSFFISVRGTTVFHAGDLNNWHWKEESTPQEATGYEQDFLRELEGIATEHPALDLVLFPVDPRLGKDYMRGAIQFINRIAVKCFVPIHFWENYEAANQFGSYAREKGVRFIALHHPGQSVVLGSCL